MDMAAEFLGLSRCKRTDLTGAKTMAMNSRLMSTRDDHLLRIV